MENQTSNANSTPNTTVCCEAVHDSSHKSKLVTGITMKVSVYQYTYACPLNRPWNKIIGIV